MSFRQACVVGLAVRLSQRLRRFSAAGATPLEGREPEVDLIQRKGLGGEVTAKPVTQFFMLVVGRVSDGFEEIVETWNTAAVLWGPRRLPSMQTG